MNNIFVGNQQKFTNNFEFVNEYFKLLTRYYSSWNYTSIHCTYYSFDLENNVQDNDKLVNGSYEMIGNLSGYRWRKYLDIPLNNVEALSTTPTADEKGVTNSEKITTCWFPSTIEIECHVHDFLLFSDAQNSDNYYLRRPPLFEVVNVERSPDFDSTFYKITIKISYISQLDIDKQINGLFHYHDYEKKLYGLDDSIILNTLLTERKKNCCNSTYDVNTGLYMEKVNLLEEK